VHQKVFVDIIESHKNYLKEGDVFDSLSMEQIKAGIQALSPFCKPERLIKFHDILNKRTSHARIVFEDPSNANNAWAALRTFDSFGIQYSDIIMNEERYANDWRRNTMGAAMGSQKWLDLKMHASTVDCVKYLKSKGYRIIASDLSDGSVSTSIWDVDWESVPVAIVMGNEERGKLVILTSF